MFDLMTDWEAEDRLVEELLSSGALAPDDAPPVLPPDIADWTPDLRLAAVLFAVDVDLLSEEDRVRYLQASDRLNNAGQARTFRAMTSISDAYRDLGLDMAEAARGAALEIRSALRLTPRTAENELDLAQGVRSRIPALLRQMTRGRLDARRARVLTDHTAHLPTAHARMVCDEVLEQAPLKTTGQLTELVRAKCLELAPEETDRRREEARADRRVVSYPNPDGTVNLVLYGLDPVHCQEILDRLNRLARRQTGGSRTMDQLRTDFAVADLRGHTGPVTKGSVHITVDLAMLAQLLDEPGDLAGYGPIVADIARQVTAQLGSQPWEWTVTGTGSGMPIADGTTRRRPTASQARRVRARTRTCAAPGCRAPAVSCDLDHIRPWAESGTTSSDELAPACERDHCTRHAARWTYRRLADGDYLWKSPLGTAYTTSGRDP
ncbi:MAG: DUF222 domain-containing protein [Acidimicrobiia bacterium]